MAYDEELADRLRELVGEQTGITEQRMFGGLAFLVRGNMAVVASGQGGLMVRVDRDESDHLVASTSARPMVMRGRPMQGWLRVHTKHLGPKSEPPQWVDRGTAYPRPPPPARQ